MAALLNDRNELLYSASSRVTGATVTLNAGTATSLTIPKTATVPVPAAITLTANVTGYIAAQYSWSYRFGNTGDFTSIVSTTNPLVLNLDSTWLTAASTSTAVQYKVAVSETAGNIGVNGSEYILSIPMLREGLDGVDAINSVQVTLYKRTLVNAAPVVTTTGNSTYTFATSQVVGQPAGWSQTIPAASAGSYLWTIQVLAASVGTSYSFANSLWSSPALYARDGSDGTNGTPGTNTALIHAYQRSATPPTTNPGAVTYSFSTNTITTTLGNSWSTTIPAGTDPLYITLATASSTGATDNILATEWTSPVLFVQNGTPGAPGSDGTDGINTATLYLYARNNNSSTAPSINTGGSITYTFATGVISGNIPSGWSQTLQPESSGSVIWIVHATAASNTATDIIANTEWSEAVVLAKKGADGSPGADGNPGANGTRGSRQLYSNSSSYNSGYTLSPNAAGAASYAVRATNLIAAAVAGTVPTTPIEGDTVTFTNGTDYVYTITYNQSTSTWNTPGTVIDGSLLVTGSVTAAKIDTRGLTIRDTSGNIILSAGVPLSSEYLATSITTSITTAQSTANSAASTASSAASTASSAASTASTAQSTANSAASTASSAVTTANSAASTASTAVSTANSAASTASSAATAAANAAAAAAAAQAAADAKLSKSSADVLSSTISINAVTGAGFRAGNLQWDANGNRTSGQGVAMTPGGLVGHNGTKTTFAVNATTGDASFAGDLSAATGTFSGTLTATAVNAVNTININNNAVTVANSSTTVSNTYGATYQAGFTVSYRTNSYGASIGYGGSATVYPNEIFFTQSISSVTAGAILGIIDATVGNYNGSIISTNSYNGGQLGASTFSLQFSVLLDGAVVATVQSPNGAATRIKDMYVDSVINNDPCSLSIRLDSIFIDSGSVGSWANGGTFYFNVGGGYVAAGAKTYLIAYKR
jgi:hypothetical protein